jgi:prepilin-type N-terminal cleavage/methylation domain-containing protein
MLLIGHHKLRFLNLTKHGGFSLVEMAVVLAIVALLLGGLLPSLTSQMDLKRINETRTQMEDIRASLIGFAVSNGRLPCPDTDVPPDGIENTTLKGITNDSPNLTQSTVQTQCSNNSGGLPYNQLGIASLDSFGSPYIYRVSTMFAEKDEIYNGLNGSNGGANLLIDTTYFKLSDNGTLKVCSNSINAGAACAPSLTSNAAAVVVSKGKNGALISSNAGENENADADDYFVSHDFSSDFDDIVIWISPNILFSRMVAAGKLP